MKPLHRGKLTGMVEIPANWYLDDLPPHLFIKNSPNSHGFVDADVTLKLWKKVSGPVATPRHPQTHSSATPSSAPLTQPFLLTLARHAAL